MKYALKQKHHESLIKHPLKQRYYVLLIKLLLFVSDTLRKIGLKKAHEWILYKSVRYACKPYNEAKASNDEKDAIIKVQLKKGGYEVQTGLFRRADCSEENNNILEEYRREKFQRREFNKVDVGQFKTKEEVMP